MDAIPLFYFQTKIAMVDDYAPFIDSIQFITGINLERYNDPSLAIKNLTKYLPCIGSNFCLEVVQSRSVEERIKGILESINVLMNNPARHHDISLLLVDYQMPSINGLDLLKMLDDKPFKKILITAEAPSQVIIDGFNKKTIDLYLAKDNKEIYKNINEIFEDLMLRYFIDLSNSALSFFPYFKEISTNKDVSRYFGEVINLRKIIEFYLIDENGVFKLIHKDGRVSYLTIYAKFHLTSLAEFAISDGASQEVVDAMIKCEKIPIFGDAKFWEIEGKDWDRFLVSTHKIDDNFYSAIKTY